MSGNRQAMAENIVGLSGTTLSGSAWDYAAGMISKLQELQWAFTLGLSWGCWWG